MLRVTGAIPIYDIKVFRGNPEPETTGKELLLTSTDTVTDSHTGHVKFVTPKGEELIISASELQSAMNAVLEGDHRSQV